MTATRTRLPIAVKTLDASERGLAASILLAALVVASLLATSHVVLAGLVAALPLLAFVTMRAAAAIAHRGPVAVAGIVWVALFASTFVWRTRSTQQLDANPLDTAGRIRVALVVLAGVLSAIVLSRPRRAQPHIPLALRLLAAYIGLSFVSALGSPLRLQAGYRSFELAVGLLAVLAALSLLGRDAGETLLRLMVGLVAVSVAVIWVEGIVVPHAAWAHSAAAFPYELQGYLPQYSSNSVGTLGGLLALYGLAHPAASRRGQVLARVALAAGVLTLLAAQYRTGIIAFVAAGSVVAWYRWKLTFAVLWIVVAFAISAVGVAPTVTQAKELFSKGRPELVGTLDDRTVYWHASKPLIRERPYLGWGMNVGSRRVLVSLGQNNISTIHSTWIEALLGTGFVGAFFLVAAYVAAVGRAWRVRAHPVGAVVVGMLLFYCVRSITGPTTEIFDIGFLLFAALICAGDQVARERAAARVARPSIGIHSQRGVYT